MLGLPRTRAFCILGLLMLLCPRLLGQQAAANSDNTARADNSSESNFQLRSPRYHIEAGDTMDITFSFTPEFNQTITVQPDGFIDLRDAGELKISGKTVAEATEAIRSAYSKILHDPVVAVTPRDFDKPHFTVGGEVNRPGKYELRADTTLMEAIAIAGGLNDRSKHSQVLLFRRTSDNWAEVRKVDIKQLAKNEDFGEDIHLRPGDMVFVPQNAMSKVKPYLPMSAVSALLYRY